MTLREAVFRADEGRCVQCGDVLSPYGDQWQWQAHHVLKQQWLKRRGQEKRLCDHELAILLCRRCHEGHESRFAPVALEKLPLRVLKSAQELGPWAEDLLRRYHPPGELEAA